MKVIFVDGNIDTALWLRSLLLKRLMQTVKKKINIGEEEIEYGIK